MNMLQAALTWHNAGCSVIPIRADGTKKPSIEWKQYQSTPASTMGVQRWFQGYDQGIGIICGAVSGGLEMLELEGRSAGSEDLEKIYTACDARNISWLLQTLLEQGYAEWTPSGGIHLLYRIIDHEVPGNTKVARRLSTPDELSQNPDDKIKVLAETRGEGGYVIVAPTGGKVHPTGDAWTTVAGEIGVIPTVSWADRCLLHEAFKAALDEMPEPVMPVAPVRPLPFKRDGLSPGDDFMQRATWQEILEPHGWRVTELHGSETFWIRPGKKFDGRGSHSATTGFKGDGSDDRLYVFSTSTVFDAERPYNKFAAYTLLEHGGSFTSAAKELSRRGYGSRGATPATPYTATPVPVAAPAPVPVAVTASKELSTVETALAPVEPVPGERMLTVGEGFKPMRATVFQEHPWTDVGAGEMFADTFAGQLRYIGEEKKWRNWDGVRWHNDGGIRPDRAMSLFTASAARHAKELEAQGDPFADPFTKFTKGLSGAQRQTAVPRIARSNPLIGCSVNDFDTHKHLITVDNGTFNLQTMQLQPHDHQLLLTRKMNTTYNPGKGTGRWGTFMEEVLPDASVRRYLQRALGYAMTGEASQRAMFLLHGNSGTGKSQVVEAMAKIFGDFASGISAGALLPKTGNSGPSDDVHKLRGTRMAFISELNQNSVLNESLIKSATGGDTLTTRALYGEYVSWRPEFVIFLATNFLPRVSSTDDAIWRRVKPIKFEQCFVDSDGAPLDPDAADKGVRIATEEPECVFNWLLEGLVAFRAEGLTPPEQVRVWTQDYRDEVDTVRQFISEGEAEGRLKQEEKLEVGSRDLYKAYVAWCVDAQQKPLSLRLFGQLMESNKFQRVRVARGVVWRGIGLIGWLAESVTPASRGSFTPMRT